ncbi:hypothetical protein [Asticcacaulis sp.]|uniref:hypothetical protein n=1 Tax=Asticcacaulis sp. TaxID=1872648 RepID=UPI002B5257BA|nr:hypothetical protein [Asticcacaulis sp.]HTM82801.1 hypothetical protein [Asticcacaulis sp.]
MKLSEAAFAARVYLKYSLIVAAGSAALYLALWSIFWNDALEIAFYCTVIYFGVNSGTIIAGFQIKWTQGLIALACATLIAAILFNGMKYGLTLAKAQGIEGAWLVINRTSPNPS